MRSSRLGSLVWMALLAGLGVFVALRMEVTNDVSELLPEGSDPALFELSRALAESELTRTITVAVHADDPASARRIADGLAERMRGEPGIAWVRRGPPAELERAFYDVYFPRRYAFLDAPTRESLRADDGLDARARALRAALTGPTAMLVRRVAQEDPLLAFAAHLERMQASSGTDEARGLRTVEGAFESADGEWQLVLLATRASAMRASETRPVLDRLEAAIDALCAGDASARVEMGGIHRIAARAEESVREDVSRVSIVSSLGIVLFFVVFFRAPRYLALGSLPLVGGMVVACAACVVLFGRVHGITLAFGSSMIGVAIDYVSHYVNHHVLDPSPEGPEGTMRRVWPGLVTGCASTVAGLAGLAWTRFPGMREMAVFGAVGVASGLLLTRVLVVPWMPREPVRVRVATWTAALLDRSFAAMSGARRAIWIVPAVALGVVLVGLPRARWNDDVRALTEIDPELRAEDQRVRERIAGGEPGRFVVALGDDEEAALVAAERAHDALSLAREAGAIEGFRSVRSMLWSVRAQRESLAAVEDATLGDRVSDALEREGFVRSMFEPFRAGLARDRAVEPLTPEMLRETPVGVLIEPFFARAGERIAVLTFVSDVRDETALRARLEALGGDVVWLDQAAMMASAYREFRGRTVELVSAGLVVVLAMLLVRYRSVRLALAAFAPAVLGALCTLSLLSLFGVTLNLLHAVGTVLVLSMGEDYGVFMVESRDDPKGPGVTMVGLFVACATTVLSFGLLALSSSPAMQALGATAGLGVLLSALLAPMSLVIAGKAAR